MLGDVERTSYRRAGVEAANPNFVDACGRVDDFHHRVNRAFTGVVVARPDAVGLVDRQRRVAAF